MQVKELLGKGFPKEKEYIKFSNKQGKDYRLLKDWIKFGFNLACQEIGKLEVETLDEEKIKKIQDTEFSNMLDLNYAGGEFSIELKNRLNKVLIALCKLAVKPKEKFNQSFLGGVCPIKPGIDRDKVREAIESVLDSHQVNGFGDGYKSCACSACKHTREQMPKVLDKLCGKKGVSND